MSAGISSVPSLCTRDLWSHHASCSKTGAAEARNHSERLTFGNLERPRVSSTHNWPSADTLAQSTATVSILIHFAAHARHGGADARDQQEHRSTTHPLSHQHSEASISGIRHHLVGCYWRFGDGHRRRRHRGNRDGCFAEGQRESEAKHFQCIAKKYKKNKNPKMQKKVNKNKNPHPNPHEHTRTHPPSPTRACTHQHQHTHTQRTTHPHTAHHTHTTHPHPH